MLSRRSVLVGVALLVAFAGCAGSPNAGEPTQVAGSAGERAALTAGTYPPGTNGTQITDADALLDAHNASLGATDYGLNATIQRSRSRWTIAFESNPRDRRSRYKCTGDCLVGYENSSYSYFRDGDDLYVRMRPDSGNSGRADYSVVAPRRPFAVAHNRTSIPLLRTTLASNETRRSGLIRRANHTYVRYSIDNSTASNRTVNGTLLVREDGLITSFGLDTVGPDGDVLRVRIRIAPSLGRSIPTPWWKDRAVRAAAIRAGGTSGGYYADGGGCDNDGDQSYREDNDRDNDGICDED